MWFSSCWITNHIQPSLSSTLHRSHSFIKHGFIALPRSFWLWKGHAEDQTVQGTVAPAATSCYGGCRCCRVHDTMMSSWEHCNRALRGKSDGFSYSTLMLKTNEPEFHSSCGHIKHGSATQPSGQLESLGSKNWDEQLLHLRVTAIGNGKWQTAEWQWWIWPFINHPRRFLQIIHAITAHFDGLLLPSVTSNHI